MKRREPAVLYAIGALAVMGTVAALAPIGEPVTAEATEPIPVEDITTLFEPVEQIEYRTQYDPMDNELAVASHTYEYWVDDANIELMARCIEAEAGTEDLDGKRLVADVILNRVDAPEFPNSISDVIHQKGAFSAVGNGAIWAVTPSEDSYKAAQTELTDRISYEILYFRTKHYHSFGTPWGKWGNHYFSAR